MTLRITLLNLTKIRIELMKKMLFILTENGYESIISILMSEVSDFAGENERSFIKE